jgi:regulator of replication initiation timing
MFRLVTSQLIDSGACRQVEIINTFGVSKSSVIRGINKLRTDGPEAFFIERRGCRKGTILTPSVLKKAQDLLNKGYTRRDTAEEISVRYDTLRKAINDGRLEENRTHDASVSKSSRTVIDAAAANEMGTACTRTGDRILASLGKVIGTPIRFETCLDVPKGGVLCSLPILLANGLLSGVECLLGKVKGYYTAVPLLLMLAFMALCRIKTVEKLRGHAPGEFGKLLGLDRIPEVRCLRNKMDDLSSGQNAERWAAHLSKQWMNADPEAVGTLYIDGHVRVYNGGLTKLPRRYVSRQRLCLRATTDYWVNDATGRPFFVVEKEIDPGLLKTLREDIIPRLLNDIPNQPTDQQLIDNQLLCRFILVFDREGYSPDFFREMWRKHRVACITYHKHPADPWPTECFYKHDVPMPNGEIITMHLSEMGTLVGSGEKAVWMREVRKLTESGHQTSLISTAFELPYTQLAARMFSRWCQENFFRYMMEHYAIDLLQEYGTEKIPDTKIVVNPKWRELNRLHNSLRNRLRYRRARFAEMTMHPETDNNLIKYRKWQKKKAELFEDIEQCEHQLNVIKANLKDTNKHIKWMELDEENKFFRLVPGRKRLMDTVRMIAYRSETAMVGLLKKPGIDSAAARRLLQDLFVTEADILPDTDNEILRVRVHPASRPVANSALKNLFDILNDAELKYPETDLKLVYEIGGQNAQL